MDGYDETTYGDRFVDVYDDWYGDITDTEACVDALSGLAEGGSVLELGVGTGRLAIPLAERGLEVVGVDASAAMLRALSAKPGGDRVEPILGDMADPPVGTRRFDLVFVAYNTLFNLTAPGAQARCIAAVARLLNPAGRFVVEAFVPAATGQESDLSPASGSGGASPAGTAGTAGFADAVTPRQVTADKVVLSVSRARIDTQEVLGQYVDITEAGIRLRPWHIRWATVDQIDAMAEAAGLELLDRRAGWTGGVFGPESRTHVSTYRHRS